MKIRREIRDFAVLLEKYMRKNKFMPGENCETWDLIPLLKEALQASDKIDTSDDIWLMLSTRIMVKLRDNQQAPQLYEYRYTLSKVSAVTNESGAITNYERWSQPGYTSVNEAVTYAQSQAGKTFSWPVQDEGDDSYPTRVAQDENTWWTITPHVYVLKDEDDLTPDDECDW